MRELTTSITVSKSITCDESGKGERDSISMKSTRNVVVVVEVVLTSVVVMV